jgi:hypothetical protein
MDIKSINCSLLRCTLFVLPTIIKYTYMHDCWFVPINTLKFLFSSHNVTVTFIYQLTYMHCIMERYRLLSVLRIFIKIPQKKVLMTVLFGF